MSSDSFSEQNLCNDSHEVKPSQVGGECLIVSLKNLIRLSYNHINGSEELKLLLSEKYFKSDSALTSHAHVNLYNAAKSLS